MTAKKEEYIKAIYLLGGDAARVSNKRVSQALRVSAASVSEMLVKLHRDGMIEYIPYRGVRLTAAGVASALVLIRNYALWETFLTRCLDYGREEARDEAEALSHATSSKLADRLDTFLEHPLNRGRRADDIVEHDVMALKEVPPGKMVRIVSADDEAMRMLKDSELNVGSRIRLMMTATPDHALIVDHDGKMMFIDGAYADRVMVEA